MYFYINVSSKTEMSDSSVSELVYLDSSFFVKCLTLMFFFTSNFLSQDVDFVHLCIHINSHTTPSVKRPVFHLVSYLFNNFYVLFSIPFTL